MAFQSWRLNGRAEGRAGDSLASDTDELTMTIGALNMQESSPSLYEQCRVAGPENNLGITELMSLIHIKIANWDEYLLVHQALQHHMPISHRNARAAESELTAVLGPERHEELLRAQVYRLIARLILLESRLSQLNLRPRYE